MGISLSLEIRDGRGMRMTFSATSMAGAENRVTPQDANEIALHEFEAGVKRNLKQADAGLVKTFKTKEEFLNHLENLE